MQTDLSIYNSLRPSFIEGVHAVKFNALSALKTDLTEIDRRIQQSLKPIEESEGKEAEEDNDVCRERHDTAEELPKEDNTAARIPSRLRQIADASGGRIVIAGVGSPPENGPAKKGIKM